MAHTVSSVLADSTLNQIIAIESTGKPKAKAPTSSAFGLFQFLNGTWMDTVRKHRPDLLHGRSAGQVLALRANTSVCIELGARFEEDNAALLGTGYTDGDIYLAHFLGAGSARKVLRSSPNASAVAVCGSKAANANRSIFYKGGRPVSCAQLRRWADAAMAHRWAALGSKDFVQQFYDPNDPLVQAHDPVAHEDAPEDAPVKHEESFSEPAVEPEEPVKADISTDVSVPDVVTNTVKSAFKSKISWLFGLVGIGGSSAAGSADPETGHLFLQLISKPFFWMVLVMIAAAGLGIFFYWRDHGKGAVR